VYFIQYLIFVSLIADISIQNTVVKAVKAGVHWTLFTKFCNR